MSEAEGNWGGSRSVNWGEQEHTAFVITGNRLEVWEGKVVAL